MCDEEDCIIFQYINNYSFFQLVALHYLYGTNNMSFIQ